MVPPSKPIGVVTTPASYWSHMSVVVPLGFVVIDVSSRTNVLLPNSTQLGNTYYRTSVRPGDVAKAVLTQDSGAAHWYPTSILPKHRRCDVCNRVMW